MTDGSRTNLQPSIDKLNQHYHSGIMSSVPNGKAATGTEGVKRGMANMLKVRRHDYVARAGITAHFT